MSGMTEIVEIAEIEEVGELVVPVYATGIRCRLPP